MFIYIVYFRVIFLLHECGCPKGLSIGAERYTGTHNRHSWVS